MVISQILLNKKQCLKIQPHLSGRATTGLPPAGDKRTLEAILFVLTTGCRWSALPPNTTVMSRHGEDIGDGHRMELLSVYGTCSFLSLNSKENLISKNVHWMARLYEQKGGPTSRQNLWRFTTSKRHAVVDGNGLPLAVMLSDGRCHDVTRALAAVESIQIGCLHRRPRGLAADKGYDSRGFRKYLSMRGIRHSIPERKKAKRRPGRPPAYHRDLSSNRWKVERFFAWLDNFRRLATRFERLCIMHLGFIQMGCVMSLLRNVLK